MRTYKQAMKDAVESGAVQAWIDGKPIQHKMTGPLSQWTTVELTDPNFNHPSCFWRPAPEPKLRPWKPEEVPHLARIRRKWWPGIEYSTIVGIGEGSVEYTTGGGCDSVRFDSALEHFTHSTDGGKTWAPCGVLEGGE